MISAQTYIEQVDSLGKRIARVASGALDRRVPPCPDWTVRDVLVHTAKLCHWIAGLVETGQPAAPGALAVGEDVVSTHSGQCEALVAALRAADPDDAGWSWGKDQHKRFWYRRAGQELAVHCWDVESASGDPLPVDPTLAADGIDEYFEEFAPNNPFFAGAAAKFGGAGERIALLASDLDRRWTVVVGEDDVELAGDGAADVTATGSASDLLLFLWGRIAPDTLDVAGDRSLLDRWRERVKL